MDEFKDELQSKIADYSKMAESGKKTKRKKTIFFALFEEISSLVGQRKVSSLLMTSVVEETPE